jgi:hypothetical protein
MLSEKSIKIGNAFHRYADSGDKSHIEHFSRKDIEDAIIQYGLDKNSPFYIAMERRIDELKAVESQRQWKREKRKDRLYWFIFGLLTGLIPYLIKLIKYLLEKGN